MHMPDLIKPAMGQSAMLPPTQTQDRLRRAMVVACSLCAGLWWSSAAADQSLEGRVKLAYLVQLTRFVAWPQAAPVPVNICFAGAPSLGDMLADASQWPQAVRPVELQAGASAVQEGCQVLFLGPEASVTPQLLRQWHAKGILTVSDAPDFARRGGMVGFFMDAGRIRLEINTDATRAANLRVNARLLQLARTVSGGA
jgi:YfiR/HmsC-like